MQEPLPLDLELTLFNSLYVLSWPVPLLPPGVDLTYYIDIVNTVTGETLVDSTVAIGRHLAFSSDASRSVCSEVSIEFYYEVEADDGLQISNTISKMENVPICKSPYNLSSLDNKP